MGIEKIDELEKSYKLELVWSGIIYFCVLHVAAVFGAYYSITSAKIATILFGGFLYVFAGLGITAGAHRLWAHRSFKANLKLRSLLMVMNTMALQYSAIDWVRDHRMHHKYSETDADPHNATRGFFFSHIGWLLCRKHPDIKAKGKNLDMSDLYGDPILRFQKKFYVPLVISISIFLPTVVPVYFWNESVKNAFSICFALRWALMMHASFCVNSIAHRYGNRPFDKNLYPRESIFVSLVSLGEGWHNFHHTFPWDYRAAELGSRFFVTGLFIELFAKIGWAYDLKTAPMSDIERRALRTGDGSYIRKLSNFYIF